jgi:hypothetical protein
MFAMTVISSISTRVAKHKYQRATTSTSAVSITGILNQPFGNLPTLLVWQGGLLLEQHQANLQAGDRALHRLGPV